MIFPLIKIFLLATFWCCSISATKSEKRMIKCSKRCDRLSSYSKIIAQEEVKVNSNNVPSNHQSFSDDPPAEKQIKKGHMKTLIGMRLAEVIMAKLLSIFISDPDILKVAASASGAVLWIVSFLSGLSRLGIDTKPILSLFSILGLTLGLAAKDILKDTFAGLFVVFMKPFKRGWIIEVMGRRGKVLSIDGRYVRLLNNKDKGEILLPLSAVYEQTINIIERNGSESL